jgi:hypothetical protein
MKLIVASNAQPAEQLHYHGGIEDEDDLKEPLR